MAIMIGNQRFENNPTGVNPAMVFMGTVHTGSGIQENVYGFNEEQVVETARKLKEINPEFNTVHIYGPENIWAPRTYVGYRIL